MNKFTYVNAFVEFPAMGNYPQPQYDVFTFDGYDYLGYGNRFFTAPDTVYGVSFIFWVLFLGRYIWLKVLDWRRAR